MKMKSFAALLLCITVIFTACSSTRIVKSWRDPEASVNVEKLNKVLVVAFLKDETSRRVAEDKMASLLNGKGVVSYSYITSDAVKKEDEQGIYNKIKRDGFDGAVVYRLIDVDKDVQYTPGVFSSYPVYYRTFGGYYMRGWNYFSTPDRYTSTRTYTVEINVYSIKQNKIIYSALTETTDPGGVDKLSGDVSNAVYKRMKKEGFLQ